MADPTPKPRFGDLIENTAASPENPTRVGYFVRAIRNTGRMNHGTWWEVTDGKGNFWQPRPSNCTVTSASPAPATPPVAPTGAAMEAAIRAVEFELDNEDREPRMHAVTAVHALLRKPDLLRALLAAVPSNTGTED